MNVSGSNKLAGNYYKQPMHIFILNNMNVTILFLFFFFTEEKKNINILSHM